MAVWLFETRCEKKLKNNWVFSGKFFEAVLASKWPQRPNMTSSLAFSWPIYFTLVLGCFIWRVWPSFELSRRIARRKSELCKTRSASPQVKIIINLTIAIPLMKCCARLFITQFCVHLESSFRHLWFKKSCRV